MLEALHANYINYKFDDSEFTKEQLLLKTLSSFSATLFFWPQLLRRLVDMLTKRLHLPLAYRIECQIN